MLHSFAQESREIADILESCTLVEGILSQIKRSVADHQCPGNSPSGHHDAEAMGGEAVFCKRFSLGCAHPLTANDPSQLPEDALSECLELLKINGILSVAQHDTMRLRLGKTNRGLWDIDFNRRVTMQRLASQLKLKGEEPNIMATTLGTFGQELDDRYRPQQKDIILERLALIIEMEAAIFGTRERLNQNRAA